MKDPAEEALKAIVVLVLVFGVCAGMAGIAGYIPLVAGWSFGQRLAAIVVARFLFSNSPTTKNDD